MSGAALPLSAPPRSPAPRPPVCLRRLQHVKTGQIGIDEVLLYASLLLNGTSPGVVAVVLGMAAALLRRHLAEWDYRLCATLLAAGGALLHQLIQWPGWLWSLNQDVAAVTGVSIPILLRATAFPAILGLLRRSVAPAAIAVAAPVVALLTLWGSVELLEFYRAPLPTAGIVLLAHVVLIEAANFAAWTRLPRHVVDGRRWLATAASAALIVFIIWPPTVKGTSRRVAILWPAQESSPEVTAEYAGVAERFGWTAIGQYGEFPAMLSRGGFSVQQVEHLCAVRADVVVILSAFKQLHEDEVGCFRKHVQDGGNALVVGEHSNLGGVQEKLAPLVEPVGLRINFDTTSGLFGDRTATFSWSASALGRSLRHSTLVHNRGASVQILTSQARPLLVGNLWHSDYGDQYAPERAFLSTHRMSEADIIGRIVLAGEASLGSGRVVLWGDSSPFLNQHLLYTSRFIETLIAQLAGMPRVTAQAWLLGLALMVLCCTGWAVRSHVISVAASITTLGLVATMMVTQSSQEFVSTTRVIVSTGEHNDYSPEPFDGRSLTGLGVSVLRAGFTPQLGDWASARTAPSSVFIVNPRAPIRGRRLERLAGLAGAGSTVIITGGGDNEHFTSLARHFGVTVDSTAPVGALKGEELNTWSAWQVSVSAEGRLLNVGNTTVGAAFTVGRGRVVVIADNGAFISRNLEGEYEFDARNVAFVQKLLKGTL